MMKSLLNVLHPAFESLSAFADAPAAAAPRTHVARHVARCAECRAVVAEIRAMGEAARAPTVESVPPDLWSRIEQAAAEAAEKSTKPRETPAPDAAPWEAAPSLRPTRHVPTPVRRSVVRVGAALACAAAALLAVGLLTGRTRSLLASDATRISFTPFRPAPGALVHVRYNPSPRLAGLDRLVLMGQYINDAARIQSDYYFGGQYDSLATLTRAPDGALVGDFRVPADFRSASLRVSDPTGRLNEGDGLFSWILVGGDRAGRPSLAALLAGSSLEMLYGSRERENVLDTLQKYFPDHPAGFATARHYRGEGAFSGLFKLFQGAERKYLFFYSKLEKVPSLDADRIVAMINFARQIEEPAEAARWTRRLVREHPTDPRTLPYFARVVHDVELREPPRDSITPYLPVLDSLLVLAGPGVKPDGEARALVNTYGDEAMQRRWLLQTLDAGTRRGELVRGLDLGDKWLMDAEIRRRGEVLLRAGLSGTCSMPRWLTRGWTTSARKENFCTSGRAAALASLSDIALRDGQNAHALALADSAVALVSGGPFCLPTGRAQRGEALLASGDTLAAAWEFAQRYGREYESWQTIEARKALEARLRPSVNAEAWETMRRKAGTDWKKCRVEASARDSLDRSVR